jgi:hypothetical protein
MTKKSIETPKANLKPDDLIKPQTKDGTIELSEHDLEKVSGGRITFTPSALDLKGSPNT